MPTQRSLTDKDCLYITERTDKEFTMPMHAHSNWELTLIQGGKGMTRVIGDHVETIPDLDLVLVTQDDLHHAWTRGNCINPAVREVSIQFAPDLIPPASLHKRQFRTIARMFERAKRGIIFSDATKVQVLNEVETMLATDDKFKQLLRFMYILYVLSLDSASRILSSDSFAEVKTKPESRRLEMVDTYIRQHYMNVIRLSDLAELVGMTEVGFSRFFKRTMNVTLSDYLIGLRVGHASRMLVDTDSTVSEIAYACGFNNLSNFNRLFRKNRGCSPHQFRKLYSKSRVLI